MHTTNESVILKKKRLKWQVLPFKLSKKTNKTNFLGSFKLEHKPKGLIRKGKLDFAQYNQQDDTSSLTDFENTIFIKFLILAKRSSPRRKSNMLGHRKRQTKTFCILATLRKEIHLNLSFNFQRRNTLQIGSGQKCWVFLNNKDSSPLISEKCITSKR